MVGRRATTTVCGLLVSVSATPLARAWAGSSDWAAGSRLIREEVGQRGGVWRGMRGALEYLAEPVLLVLGCLITYAAWQVARRQAVAYIVVGLVANLSVQGVKHGLFVHGGMTLSGHVGVASAVCLGWLAFAARQVRTGTAAAAAAAVPGGVGCGVVLSGWHTVPEVLCPLGIVTGTALLGQAALGALPADDGETGNDGPQAPALLAAMGCAGLVLAGCLGAMRATDDRVAMVVLAMATTLAAAVLAGCAVLLVRSALQIPPSVASGAAAVGRPS